MKTIRWFWLLCITLCPLHSIANDYAMVFFFSSDCGYCHQFAPTLRQFEAQTGLQTYPFTIDGGALPDYPVPIPSTPAIAAEFFDNPRDMTVPATFLIHVQTRQFVKVSIGNVTLAQLHDTVGHLFQDPAVMAAMQARRP